MQPARKEKVLGSKPGLLDPCGHGRPRRLGQLELNRTLRFSLHDHRAREHLASVGHVANPQADEITSSKLTVDREVVHGEVTHLVGVLQRMRIAQTSLGLSGAFWPTSFPLFPGS